MTFLVILVFLALLLCVTPVVAKTATETEYTEHEKKKKPPNIVILLVDDVGIGDIGCYGNDTLATPNIDRLCRGGVKLNHHLAAAPLCTPSRAALLTGRYPVRLGYVARTAQERRVTIFTTAKGGLPQNETTFPEVLKSNGYTNAFLGKWHLGIHCGDSAEDFCHHPLKHGFDYYYGMPLTNVMECGEWPWYGLRGEIMSVPRLSTFLRTWLLSVVITVLLLSGFALQSRSFIASVRKPIFLLTLLLLLLPPLWYSYHMAQYYLHRQLNCVVMRGTEVVQQPARLDRITGDLVREANAFVTQNKDNRFLMYVSFHKAHTALATAPRFVGKSAHGSYGDAIMEMDWAVGEILDTFAEFNLTDNTVVIFTSDHGPALNMHNELTGEYQGGWPGVYRGGKGYNYEGGIRVPMIVQWPAGKMRPGRVIDRPTSHLDIFPTVLSMSNIENDNSNNDGKSKSMIVDGEDILDLLKESGAGQHNHRDRILFHYCGIDIHAVTIEEQSLDRIWKIHFVIPKPYREVFYASCYGDSILKLGHDKPVIYDLVHSPSENVPLLEADVDYERIRRLAVGRAVELNETVDYGVPNQLAPEMNSFSLWERVPCCKPFPWCYC